MDMFWCDFMAGWVGGKIYLKYVIAQSIYGRNAKTIRPFLRKPTSNLNFFFLNLKIGNISMNV